MKIPDKWWSYPAEGENGRTVIVTGHDGLDSVIASGKYIYRLDVSWQYDALPDGMPTDEDAEMMEKVTDALTEELKRDKAVVMTGIYTGDGRRDWVFYTKNLRIFSALFNRALESLPQLPLLIEASEDAEWEEYREMRETTYVPDEE